jgi:hypothetical protein
MIELEEPAESLRGVTFQTDIGSISVGQGWPTLAPERLRYFAVGPHPPASGSAAITCFQGLRLQTGDPFPEITETALVAALSPPVKPKAPPTPWTPGNAAAAIALLDSWLGDESGYDEQVWPEVKRGLEEHRLSSRKLFHD